MAERDLVGRGGIVVNKLNSAQKTTCVFPTDLSAKVLRPKTFTARGINHLVMIFTGNWDSRGFQDYAAVRLRVYPERGFDGSIAERHGPRPPRCYQFQGLNRNRANKILHLRLRGCGNYEKNPHYRPRVYALCM